MKTIEPTINPENTESKDAETSTPKNTSAEKIAEQEQAKADFRSKWQAENKEYQKEKLAEDWRSEINKSNQETQEIQTITDNKQREERKENTAEAIEFVEQMTNQALEQRRQELQQKLGVGYGVNVNLKEAGFDLEITKNGNLVYDTNEFSPEAKITYDKMVTELRDSLASKVADKFTHQEVSKAVDAAQKPSTWSKIKRFFGGK